MAIIQQPDALSLSGNLKKFIISSGGQITFSLTDGATTLIEATYEPGADGQATIDIKDIVVSRLSYLVSSNVQSNIAKTFTATIDGTVITFKVIRAGVANLADTPTNWLQGNFLTWQPTNKQITYYSPEWLTYYAVQACNIKLKAYFPDNTVQNINLSACEAGKAFTINVQYAFIAGLLGQRYPTHYDVWAEDLTGNRLSYIQRYLYSEAKSELEQWFLFENSLGGLDTIRAYGDTDFNGEHDHKLSTTDNVTEEYQIDTTRNYSKNTGYLDEYERRWLLDFFPSKKKYIYSASALRKIIVSESDVKYSSSDLPSNYTFTYRFTDTENAALLNLIRTTNIPDNLTIPNISSPDFCLPPRLSEYPRVTLSEGVILPAFDPNSDIPTVTTLGELYNVITGKTLSQIPGADTGGQLVNILKELDTAPITDNNVFSALRTLLEIKERSISKISPDTAQGLIKFLDGIDINFIRGISGGNIDKYANAELNSLRLREFLEVPELRYNRISVFTGVQWNTFGAGIIESVEVDKDVNGNELQSGIIKLKLENGEFGSVAVDDLCQGIFHNFGGVNDTTSEDQKNGNFHIKGFNTSYFRITEILDTGTNGLFRYVLRGTSEKWTQLNHPRSQMHFAAYANPSNPDRQSCSYTTTEYSIRLKNMTTWEYGANNIYEISGKLDGFTIGETVLEGKGQAFGNAYIWGTLQNIYNDPIRLDIDTNGDGFLAFGETMTITCNVFKGWKDITSNVEIWGISRESGNQTEDDAWNISHQDFAGQITLQNKAEYSDLGNGISTLFRFTASSASNTAILELTI